jgi:hypothetical protein
MGVELGQTIWDKNLGVIGNILGNAFGTLWELGNLMGTHWEQGRKKQKLLVPTPHSKRKKKIGSIMSAC